MSASRARGSRELTTVNVARKANEGPTRRSDFVDGPATTSPAAQQTSVSVKHIRFGVPLRYDGKPRVLLHNIVKLSVSD